jgi:uncharacterized protein (DUF2062 family)
VVFKRRDRRSIGKAILDFVWPRGGWGRAFNYVRHRVQRLPDTPEKISRGIWAGVFITFSPFYGLHMVIGAVIALVMRGNIVASLMATFFGNPLTYLPIAYASLATGHWMLGTRLDLNLLAAPEDKSVCGIGCQFSNAFRDLWHNFKAIFTHEKTDWHGLLMFYDEVFLPYMVGGILPGIIAATICYYVSVPVIRAYQNSRRKALRAKLEKLHQNQADD